jgi:serine/threonine-protein kinase
VLYQLLTGQRPFQGDSMVALAMKITQDDPPPMDKLRPGLPPALRRVVERCLSKQPDRRFQTGQELAAALTKVLAEIDEAAQAKNRPRVVPLRVKWAGMMALIVALVMAAAGALISQRQYAAMMAQVSDNGASLARFIAAQHAVSALAEDWITVDVAVKHVMQTGDLQSITVVDRFGVVQVSPDAAAVGKLYKAPASESLGTRAGGVAVKRYTANGESVLGFDAPITFQNNPVGRVSLGIREKPLTQVARLSIALMGALVLVTVLAVAVAMYFVADWFAKPIKLLRESMGEIAKGRFDHRIREQRRDEFGQLYSAFDQMAQALEDRRSGAGPVTPAGSRTPSGIETPARAPAASGAASAPR